MTKKDTDSVDKQQDIKKPHRWKKGESGNLDGRPKLGTAIADVIRSKFDEIDEETGKTKRELAVEAQVNKAVRGDDKAMNFLTDRTEGKPKQSIEINEQPPPFEDYPDEPEEGA